MGRNQLNISVPAAERDTWKAFAESKHWTVSKAISVAMAQMMRSERLTEILVREAAKSITYEDLLREHGDDGEQIAKLLKAKRK